MLLASLWTCLCLRFNRDALEFQALQNDFQNLIRDKYSHFGDYEENKSEINLYIDDIQELLTLTSRDYSTWAVRNLGAFGICEQNQELLSSWTTYWINDLEFMRMMLVQFYFESEDKSTEPNKRDKCHIFDALLLTDRKISSEMVGKALIKLT